MTKNINQGRHFFYARVSTKEQNLGRQLARAKELGITDEYIYIDKLSGKNLNRKGLQDLLATVQKHDYIHVIELSRISRNYSELQATIQQLKLKGVKLIADDLPTMATGDESLDNALSDIFIALLGWVADNERKKTLERQRQGIELAKKKGRYTGGKVLYSDDTTGRTTQEKRIRKDVYNTIKRAYDNDSLNKMRLAKELGISRTTVYNIVRRIEKAAAATAAANNE